MSSAASQVQCSKSERLNRGLILSSLRRIRILNTIIVVTKTLPSQPKKLPQSVPLCLSDAVQMQNNVYQTLAAALNRLDGQKHRAYVIRVLQMMMIPDVGGLSTSVLVDLLFFHHRPMLGWKAVAGLPEFASLRILVT